MAPVAARMRPLSPCFKAARIWRNTERASLEKKPSMRFSQEPCFGVKMNSKRPSGCVASQALVSLEAWAGMMVEDQLDRGRSWIGRIEELQKFVELARAMRSSTRAWTLPVTRPIPAKRLSVPCRLEHVLKKVARLF